MRNDGCDHVGHGVYVRRVIEKKSVHYCVQCEHCLQILKTPRHGYRLYIKQSEIPSDQPVFPFKEG